MGVAQNALLGAGAAIGVASSKFATGMSQISEANDASKNEMMAQKAMMNSEKLKQLKLQNKNLRLRNKQLKQNIERGGKR